VGENRHSSDPYRAVSSAVGPRDIVRLMLVASLLAISGDLLLLRLPLTFSSPDVVGLRNVILLSGLVGLTLGGVIGIATRAHVQRYLGLGFLAAAQLVQICAWLYWLGFDGHWAYPPLFAVLPFASGTVMACVVIWVAADVLRATTPDRLLQLSVMPLHLFSTSAFLYLLACSFAFTGALLCATVLGALLLAFAATHVFGKRSLVDTSWRVRLTRYLYVLAALTTLTSGACALVTLPNAVVRMSNHRVVHYSRGKVRDLRVTSGQDAFHVFDGNRLRFTTLDQHRWAEALTRPALARLVCPKRALVFSLGEGLVERELLKSRCIQSITSVVRDRIAVDAGKRQYWWRRVIEDAWNSSRVHFIESDPAVWLNEDRSEKFDLAVMDLPDPEDFVDAKYYTKYFYQRLRKVLTTHSLVVTQATAALRTPKTFSSIRATLDAAGFHTLPFHVAMTTLGDWYFVLAGISGIPNETPPLLPGAAYSFIIPTDARIESHGRVSRLEDPAALETFLEETGTESP